MTTYCVVQIEQVEDLKDGMPEVEVYGPFGKVAAREFVERRYQSMLDELAEMLEMSRDDVETRFTKDDDGDSWYCEESDIGPPVMVRIQELIRRRMARRGTRTIGR